jgi:hypothetical protein
MPKVLVMSALLTLLLGAVAPAGATAEPTQVLAHGPGSHGESGGVTIVGGPANDEVVISNPDPSTILVVGLAGATLVQECQLLFEFSSFGPDACGCESVDSMSVSCNTPYGTHLQAGLSDGDDRIRVLDPMTVGATGGGGVDRLTG